METQEAEGREFVLRDGTRALVRPIRADDKERLVAGLAELSPESRYMRFHSAVSTLTERQLRHLTEIDYHDHMAYVAINLDAPDEPGMGVARYIRLAQDPTIAEAAVTVLDRYQGRGLGTLLLRELSAYAVEHGIRTFRNYVLASNSAMLDIFDELGGIRRFDGAGVYQVDVPLDEAPVEPPERSTPERMLREAARGVLPPFRFVFPWTARWKEHKDAE
jgi:GNAT superfamily N-acetyltransferase